MAKKGIWVRGEGRKQKIEINKRMLQHRANIHKAMAVTMNKVRIDAHDHVIEKKVSPFDSSIGYKNKFRQYSPRLLSKLQPSTSGRLTSRTNKLRYMLKHSTSILNPFLGWTGLGTRIIAKQRSVAFDSMIRQKRLTGDRDEYRGTIRVNVKGDGKLFSTFGGAPKESLQTLAVRFQWEFGIRGETRPIFKPFINKARFDMRRLVQMKNVALKGVI